MKFFDKAREKLKPSKATRDAAMQGLVASLRILEALSDGIPVVGDPLKTAVGVAIQLLEQAEAAKGNAEVFDRLKQDIDDLTKGVFTPLKDFGLNSSDDLADLVKDITEFTDCLNSICRDIHDKSRRGFFSRFVSASKDEGDIIEFKDKINSTVCVVKIRLGTTQLQNQAAQIQDQTTQIQKQTTQIQDNTAQIQEQAKRIHQQTSQIQEQNTRIESLTITIRDYQENAKFRELVNKLPRAQTAAWDAGRSNAPVSCFEGTREGVLQTITEWIDGDVSTTPRVLWLNGLAGIGKSTIARTIAERAHQRGILGGSFFFSRNDNELNNVEHLFSTLAYQLTQFDTPYLKAVASALEKDGDLGHKDIATQFKDLFLDPIIRSNHKSTVLLVLDALDEALPEEPVRRVLQFLLSVDTTFAFRIFLTSRPEAHIRLVFDNDKHHSHYVLHNIEDSIVESDIRRFLEFKLPAIPQDLGLSLPGWPSASDLDAVVGKSGRLFIFATTVIRFVADNRILDPRGRLTQFLHSQAALGPSTYKQLDQLYLHVLQSAVAGVDDNEHISRLRATLAAIVLFQNPIPLAALAALIGHDPDQVLRSLYHLHSIILVPSTVQDTPKIYHLSFPDFITDASRCTDKRFYVDIQSQEISLLLQCLGTMMKTLHYNMGDFDMGPYTPTSFSEYLDYNEMVTRHVPEFKSMSNKDISHGGLISSELGYACQFWCSHLLKIENSTSEMLDQLKVFSFEYLLFWVEAMSLLGLVEPARVAMRDAHQWASKSGCEKDLIDILYDGYRLIWLYQSQILIYAMNVYLIAFTWTPQDTVLYKTYKNKSLTTSEVVCSNPLTWSPMLSSRNAPYEKNLYSVAYASDGQYFVTGSEDGSIDLWDTLSGAHIRSFETKFPKPIFKICFLSDSQYLVSTSIIFQDVYLWDTITGKYVLIFQGHSASLNDVSVTQEQLATASNDETVKIWDIKTAECQSTLQHSNEVNSVWLDPKEDRLLSATRDEVLIWNPTTREQVRVIPKPGLWKLIVSSCGNFVACAFLNILEISKSQEVETCIKSIQSTQPQSAMFSSCGNYIVFPQQYTIVISRFQLSDKSEIRLQANMSEVAFSPDSKQLVSVYKTTCSLWDLDTRTIQAAQYYTSHKFTEVTCMTVSDNQDLYAISDRSDYITIWNSLTNTMTTFKAMLPFPNTWIALAFSIDNLLLAIGSKDSKVLILNLQTQERNNNILYSEEEVIKLAFKIKDECTTLTFSSDKLQLAVGNNNGKVWIFNINTKEQVFYLDTQPIAKIQRIIFLNNNQRLIIADSYIKYQYDLKLPLLYMLISKENNKDLYTQNWKTEDIIVTEQNLVLLKLQNKKYSLLFQIIDSINKSDIKIVKINNLVVLSFMNIRYIFTVPTVIS